MNRVYLNLTRNSFSVQKYIKGVGWRLDYHTTHLMLKDVKFICFHATRIQVIREEKKYVHAYFQGEIVESSPENSVPTNFVTYNPYFFPKVEKEKYTYERYNSDLDKAYVLNSFWDITDSVPRSQCKFLELKIEGKRPVLKIKM